MPKMLRYLKCLKTRFVTNLFALLILRKGVTIWSMLDFFAKLPLVVEPFVIKLLKGSAVLGIR